MAGTAKRCLQNDPQSSSSSSQEEESFIMAGELIGHNIDFVKQILPYLSPKSLIRCMVVSKTWYPLARGFLPSWHGKSLGLFLNLPSLPLGRYQYIPLAKAGNESECGTNPLNFFRYSKIVQSCNGLLLLLSVGGCFPERSYFLYNFVNGIHFVLPRIHGIPTTDITGIYVVYDPYKSSQYKVVAVAPISGFVPMNIGPDNGIGLEFYQINVFSSATGKWKRVGVTIRAPFTVKFAEGVLWNNTNSIIWINYQPNSPSLCFDVGKERLNDIVSPPIKYPFGNLSVYLKECGGSLHLIEFHSSLAMEFDVYELKKDFSEWFLKYHIDFSDICGASHVRILERAMNTPCLLSLLHGDNEDDISLVFYRAGQIMSYNLKDKTSRKLCDFSIRSVELDFSRWGHTFIHHHVMPINLSNHFNN